MRKSGLGLKCRRGFHSEKCAESVSTISAHFSIVIARCSMTQTQKGAAA